MEVITTKRGVSIAPNACAGDPLACVDCCSASHPAGYEEFLAELELSQCACSGSRTSVCFGEPPTVTQTCAECMWVTNPKLYTSVSDECTLHAQIACVAFATCLATCQPS
jgi:hypothetical protein